MIKTKLYICSSTHECKDTSCGHHGPHERNGGCNNTECPMMINKEVHCLDYMGNDFLSEEEMEL